MRICIREQLKDRREDRKAKAKIRMQEKLGWQNDQEVISKLILEKRAQRKQLTYRTPGAVS